MKSEVQFLTSDLLTKIGVKHGWFMRYGGVSDGLFESLNGKKGIGDPDENVDENRKRALASLCHPGWSETESKGILSDAKRISQQARDDAFLVYIKHEFKSEILRASSGGEYENFDAAYTTKPDLVLSQTTADCASVIISDINHKVVALVHGSWHTLRDKIICDVVAKMKKHTSAEIIAGLGPMICRDCYEYGSEATGLFDAKYLTSKNGKYLIDLKGITADQLRQSGVIRIDDVNICTFEDRRFFSHRRNGARSGRFLTLAQL